MDIFKTAPNWLLIGLFVLIVIIVLFAIIILLIALYSGREIKISSITLGRKNDKNHKIENDLKVDT